MKTSTDHSHSEKEDSQAPQGDEEPFFAELDFELKFPKVISNAPIKTADEKFTDKYGERYRNRNPVKTGRGRSSGSAKPFQVDSLFKVAPTFDTNQMMPDENKELTNKMNALHAQDSNLQKPCKFGGAKPEPSEVWSQELALRSEANQHYEFIDLSEEEDGEEEEDNGDDGYVIPERYRSDFEHDPMFFSQVRKGTTLEDFIKPVLPKSKRKE